MKNAFLTLVFISLIAIQTNAQESKEFSNKIANYSALINKGEVNLNWGIINPVNVYKFRIEVKKAGTENYNFLSDVLFSNFRKKENSDSLTAFYYTFANSPEENGVYYYKISTFESGNRVLSSEEIKVGITEVPEFKLNQNNPNPFNPSTIISYKLLVPANVKLSIYSLTGQYVDILLDEFQNPGTYSIEFNTSMYPDLSSGIYFYKLETNYTSDIKKMIFTK